MILHHKAKRIDNNDEVKGFLTKMWGQYHIVAEDDENTAFLIDENTLIPCYEELDEGLFWTNDIIFSDNLTSEESSMFVWLLKKAQGKLKSKLEAEKRGKHNECS